MIWFRVELLSVRLAHVLSNPEWLLFSRLTEKEKTAGFCSKHVKATENTITQHASLFNILFKMEANPSDKCLNENENKAYPRSFVSPPNCSYVSIKPTAQNNNSAIQTFIFIIFKIWLYCHYVVYWNMSMAPGVQNGGEIKAFWWIYTKLYSTIRHIIDLE